MGAGLPPSVERQDTTGLPPERDLVGRRRRDTTWGSSLDRHSRGSRGGSADAGRGRGGRRRTHRAQREGGAERRDPEPPAGAPDEPGEIEDGEAREGRGEDVPLIQQVHPARDEACPAEQPRKGAASQDENAQRDGPRYGAQLAEVLPEQGSAELVLCQPGGFGRGLGHLTDVLVDPGEGGDDEDPAEEADNGEHDG